MRRELYLHTLRAVFCDTLPSLSSSFQAALKPGWRACSSWGGRNPFVTAYHACSDVSSSPLFTLPEQERFSQACRQPDQEVCLGVRLGLQEFPRAEDRIDATSVVSGLVQCRTEVRGVDWITSVGLFSLQVPNSNPSILEPSYSIDAMIR